MPRTMPGGRRCRKSVAFFATPAMNESASPPRMMFSNMHNTIKRKAASTTAQPIVRNRIRKVMSARGGAFCPTPRRTSDQRAFREKPQDDGDRDQPGQAVFPKIGHHPDDIADDAAEERQGSADQQRGDDRQRQQHQSDIGEAADPHFGTSHCVHWFPPLEIGTPPSCRFFNHNTNPGLTSIYSR